MGLTWKVQEHSTHACRVVERRGEEKELCSSRVQHKTLIFTFYAYKVDWICKLAKTCLAFQFWQKYKSCCKNSCKKLTSQGYSKSTDVYYWHKLRKTSASRLFRFFLNILGANQKWRPHLGGGVKPLEWKPSIRNGGAVGAGGIFKKILNSRLALVLHNLCQ